jgi:serine/threonine-protein kinase
MNDPSVIQAIEAVLESGCTPEQACESRPELLPEVIEQLKRIRSVQEQIGALFPEDHQSDGPLSPSPRASGPRIAPTELPTLPGYTVESFLGSGGMGVVYKAHHLKLNRPVAVKMLLSGAYASQQELECLIREAQAVAGLHHPNIIHVYDVGELNGLPYFTMEFIEGGTLVQALGGVPQPAHVAATLMVTLADAVQAAHRGGIVHRDLKPSNILRSLDGTLKIADFSLARSFTGDSAATISTARVGTPSYMAPEQALGKPEAFCPPVDIYALGAILYEMLTGRPPFRAETSAETQRQVVTEEPASPSRLNAKVPRDLENVCLKCLSKEPQRRYPSAEALKEDLHRFLRGEPTLARPMGRPARILRWAQRRPAEATAVIVVALASLSLVSGGAWWGWQRERMIQAVHSDLADVARHQSETEWDRARTSLERAKARLADGGPEDLRRSVVESQNALDMVARLDKVRMIQAAVLNGRLDWKLNNALADREYEAAFKEAGILVADTDEPTTVAARIARSSTREALIGALDAWAACNNDSQGRPRRDRLLNIARLADPDPLGWRQRARDPETWDNPSALAHVTASVPDSERALSLLLALGQRLRAKGGEWRPFLTRVQQSHPTDFWANTSLALAIAATEPQNAIRYFQAAIVIRPDAAIAHANLGIALGSAGQHDEAEAHLMEALRLDESLAFARNGLGSTLLLKGYPDRAIAEFRRAIELDPLFVSTYNNLGKALAETGDQAAAAVAFSKALEIDPEFTAAMSSLALVLHGQGESQKAIELCRRALKHDPTHVASHINLAIALKAIGQREDALVHLRQAVELAPLDADANYNLGISLYEAGYVSESRSHYETAIQSRPNDATAHHGLGVTVGDLGDLPHAIACFQRALELDPKHLISAGALGRAYMEVGRFEEARAAFERYREALPTDHKMNAVLSRFVLQCDELMTSEELCKTDASAADFSMNAAEYLRCAEIARMKRSHSRAAELYLQAFRLNPDLPSDLRTGARYNAACSAALAGAATTDESQMREAAIASNRKEWRLQAIEWLTQDIEMWKTLQARGDTKAIPVIRSTLQRWRATPQLSSVRDATGVAQLSEAEREACLKLWVQVDATLVRLTHSE